MPSLETVISATLSGGRHDLIQYMAKGGVPHDAAYLSCIHRHYFRKGLLSAAIKSGDALRCTIICLKTKVRNSLHNHDNQEIQLPRPPSYNSRLV